MIGLTPKQIADWHRMEAKKHQDLANFHKKTADTIDSPGKVQELRKERRDDSQQTTLTLAQFEAALREKGGRVNHLAARLQASEDTIWDLLNDPNCQFAVGDRGFIYPKEAKTN